MSTDSYSELAKHLDKLPGGFPPSETGADIRLLKRLFSPEQAELAVHLTIGKGAGPGNRRQSRDDHFRRSGHAGWNGS